MGNGNAGAALGPAVLHYARGKMGQQVGSGECYDLADRGLGAAGAKSAPAYGTITDDADYVWGAAIDPKDAQPGDVIQFRDSVIETDTTTVEVITQRDGSSETKTTTTTQTLTREHHTAVVEENLGNGVLKILEQNVTLPGHRKPTRKVVRGNLPWKDSTVRKPKEFKVLPHAAKRERTVTVETTVSGTIWVYRPEAK